MVSVATPASASAPVLLSGSQWLGGNGVNVCAPSTDPYCGNQYHVGGWSGNWWQCIELAQRLYQARGWHNGIFASVNYAYQIYDQAPALGMSRQANGGITTLVPGDMIIHASNEPYSQGAGHVSIVNSVVGSTVNVVEQNTYNNDPTGQYTLSGGTLSRAGAGTIRGVVHDPANMATPPPPPTSKTDGMHGTTVVAWGPDRLDVFTRGLDNRLWHVWYQSGVWHAWEPLGGCINAAPSAVSYAAGRLDVFVRGCDNKLWHAWYDTELIANWQWEDLGGCLGSGPGAVATDELRLTVFMQGCTSTNPNIWYLSYTPSGWTGWTNMTGCISGSPSATSWSPSRMDLFARGCDGHIYHTWYNNGWSGAWDQFGGCPGQGPNATSMGVNHLELFFQGCATSGQNIAHKAYSQAGWTGWLSYPGCASGSPSLDSWGLGRMDMFIRGCDGHIYHTWYQNGWTNQWEDLWGANAP